MLDRFNSEDGPGRAYVDINATLDSFDFDDEIKLEAEDFNYALGRPVDLDADLDLELDE